MVGSFTLFGANAYLNHIFGGNVKSSFIPYLGGFVTSGSKNGPGTEPSGNGYSRVLVGSAFWSTPFSSIVQSIQDIVFPRSSANWGQMVGLGLFNSASSGDCLIYWDATDVELIENLDRLVVLAGGLTFSFVSGNMSEYLEHAILNDLFHNIPIPTWPSLYKAAYTTAPSATSGGTEPTAGAYSRIATANSAVSFPVATAGIKTNAITFTWPEATADWGTMTHFGWHDSASGGQFLWGGALNPAKQILALDELSVPASSMSLTLT